MCVQNDTFPVISGEHHAQSSLFVAIVLILKVLSFDQTYKNVMEISSTNPPKKLFQHKQALIYA